MNKIINSQVKLDILEISIRNHYSQWEKLSSLDGRLLILLAFWRESNTPLNDESTLSEMLKLLLNLNDETIVIFEKALIDLSASGTIYSEKNPISFASKISEITVNEKVVEWLKEERFLKLNSLKSVETESLYFVKYGKAYRHILLGTDDFGREGSITQIMKDVKFEGDLEERDLFKLAQKTTTDNLELTAQESKSCYLINAIFKCKFKIIDNTISFADQHTQKIFEIFPAENAINEIQRILSEHFEVNENFEFTDSDDELEEVVNTKEFINDIVEKNLIEPSEGIYIVKNEFCKPYILEKEFVFKNEKFNVNVLAKLVYTSDEVAEILVQNKKYTLLSNLSTDLAVSIFKILWFNSKELSANEKNWLIKEVLVNVPVSELYKNIDKELLFLLSDKTIVQMINMDIKLGKEMKFKKFVDTKRIFDLMSPSDVFKLFDYSIDEASKNEFLMQNQEFAYLRQAHKFMEEFDFDNLKMGKDDLEQSINEFTNAVNAAKPFSLKEFDIFAKKLKNLKIKLFTATKEDVINAAGKLRDRLEEIVCEELSISSVPFGQFKKYVAKIARFSKNELSSINNAYAYASDQLHYKIDSDKKKDPDSVIKKLEALQTKFNNL